MSILVIENTSEVDYRIIRFVEEKFPTEEVVTITNIAFADFDIEKKNELIAKLARCKKLMMFTTFLVGTNEAFDIIKEFPNIEEIFIMLDSFRNDDTLTLRINQLNDMVNVRNIINEKKVYQIFWNEYNLDGIGLTYKYDIVELYIHSSGYVGLTRQAQIPLRYPHLLKDKNIEDSKPKRKYTKKIDTKAVSSNYDISFSESEKDNLNGFFDEIEAFLKHQKVLREENNSEFIDESNDWINIASKIKSTIK